MAARMMTARMSAPLGMVLDEGNAALTRTGRQPDAPGRWAPYERQGYRRVRDRARDGAEGCRRGRLAERLHGMAELTLPDGCHGGVLPNMACTS